MSIPKVFSESLKTSARLFAIPKTLFMFLIFFVDEVFQNLHDVNILVACPDLYTSNLTSESDDYCIVNLKTVAFVLSPVDSVGKVVDVSVGSHDLHIDIYI